MIKKFLSIMSEVYSFGAVAFFLYTGVVPVAYGPSMEDYRFKEYSFEEKLEAVTQGRIRSFEQAGAGPFPELERILMRCLETNREKRYPTFKALLSDLEVMIMEGFWMNRVQEAIQVVNRYTYVLLENGKQITQSTVTSAIALSLDLLDVQPGIEF